MKLRGGNINEQIQSIMTPIEKAENLLVVFNDDTEAAQSCVDEIIRVCSYWNADYPNLKTELKYWEEVAKILIHK